MEIPGKSAGGDSIFRLGSQFADRRPRIPRPAVSNVSPEILIGKKKHGFSAPVGKGALDLPPFGPGFAVRCARRKPESTQVQGTKILIGKSGHVFKGKRRANGEAENRAGLKPKARPYNINGGGK